jgi:hypothetical protein
MNQIVMFLRIYYNGSFSTSNIQWVCNVLTNRDYATLAEYPDLIPCWLSDNQFFLSQIFLRYDAITCSICLQITEAKLIGL